MGKIRDAGLQLRKLQAQKVTRTPEYQAVIVEMRNSAGVDSVEVENQPFHVWVRLWAAQGSVVPAFNDRVAAIDGLAVIVQYRLLPSGKLEIIRVDDEVISGLNDPPNPGVLTVLHAESHEWPDAGPGIDPVTVYPRAWSQLKTYAQNPLSLLVSVSPLRYYTGAGTIIFGGGAVDLTATVGALAAGRARLVLVYLDPATNTLGTANGAIGFDVGGWFLPEPTIPAGVYSSAVVRIYNGQTEIDEDDIRDRRAFLNATQGGGWPYDTETVTVDSLDVNADAATIAEAIALSAAGDLILVGPETFSSNNQVLAASVNLSGLDRDQTVLRTAASLIALTINDDCYISDVAVDNDQTNAATITALLANGANAELRDVIATVDNDGVGDSRGIAIGASVTSGRLVDCDAEAVSGAGDGFALRVVGVGTTEVRDGKYDGDTADVYVGATATAYLFGPVLVNATIAGAGTVKGYHYDADGDLYSVGGADLFVPDNLADAWHIEDGGALEYLRVISTDANPYLSLFPAGGGRVGIGTAAPGQLFHARTTAAATAAYAQVEAVGANSTAGFIFRGTGDTDACLVQLVNTDSGVTWLESVRADTNDSLIFYAFSVGWKTILRMDTDGDIIIPSGDLIFVNAGSGLIFGSCYGNHIGWQQIAAAQNTWYNISIAAINTGQLNGVTHNGTGMLTVTEPGRYLVTYSCCYQDDKANDHLEAGISINGAAAEAAGRTHSENKFAGEEEHLGGCAILSLADNATIELAIRTTDPVPAPTIDVQGVNLSVVQIGG